MKREKERIEKPTQQYALISLGVPFVSLKFIEGVETGWPDSLFLIPGGRPMFIEFKWPGEDLEPKQVYQIFILLNMGYDVEVHDNVEEACAAIADRISKVGATAVHETRSEILARTRMCRFIPRSGPAQDFYNSGSLHFLKEAKSRKQDVGDRAHQGMLPRVARRGR
jgi:hypothetical protein